MRSNGSSEHLQNNKLKVVIALVIFYFSSIERNPLSSCITSST